MLNEKSLTGGHLVPAFSFLSLPWLEGEIGPIHFTSGMIVSEHVVLPVAHGYCGVH